jgi:hypothetical protein
VRGGRPAAWGAAWGAAAGSWNGGVCARRRRRAGAAAAAAVRGQRAAAHGGGGALSPLPPAAFVIAWRATTHAQVFRRPHYSCSGAAAAAQIVNALYDLCNSTHWRRPQWGVVRATPAEVGVKAQIVNAVHDLEY